MLKYLPNSMTILRLLLAFPVGYMILRSEYEWALGLGFVAGVTDALDGYFARLVGHFSRFGAALDPIADKVLMTVIFFSLAWVGLIPWWLAILVFARDLVIVTGACCYHWLVGPLEFEPTRISKNNTAVQIGFCVLMLSVQVIPSVPGVVTEVAIWVVVVMAIASGVDYVLRWALKAKQNYGTTAPDVGD